MTSSSSELLSNEAHTFSSFTTPIIIITLLIGGGLAIIAYLITRSRSTSSHPTIAIAGEMGVGKTLLFHRLRAPVDKPLRQITTFTSLSPNDAVITPAFLAEKGQTTSIRVVDIPGHGSYRSFAYSLIPSVSVFVFVIDATNAVQIETAAASLYAFLTNPEFVKKGIPTIVVLNKSDLGMAALSQEKAQQMLLNAIKSIRNAKKNITELESLNGTVTQTIPLTQSAKIAYDFSNGPTPVTVISASAKTGDLKALHQVLSQYL